MSLHMQYGILLHVVQKQRNEIHLTFYSPASRWVRTVKQKLAPTNHEYIQQ